MKSEPLPVGDYDVILMSLHKPQARFRVTTGEFVGRYIFMPLLSMAPSRVTISHKEHEHDNH